MMTPNPYSAIDPVIDSWAKAHSRKLFTSDAGGQARFCHFSSDRGECFQISIEPPLDATVTINAWSIETLDDREMHEGWTVPIDELNEALDLAFDRVREWLDQ
jgi:hypothetical protein